MFGLIDRMMHLRLDLEQRFKQELDEFATEKTPVLFLP